MASFKSFIDRLLGNKQSGNPTQPSREPVIHEMIERGEGDQESYQTWKNSKRMARTLQFTKMEYHKNVQEEANMLGATFFTFQKQAAKGFILNFREDIFSPLEFQHYFDYLKEKILELDYKLYSSDVRTFNRQDFVERIERHYMKPRYRLDDEERFIQQYGNIIITQTKRDDKPVYLQFMCNRYQDRKYTTAQDFPELIDHILHDA